MKITVTERNSVSINDIDFSELESEAEVTYYDAVAQDELALAIGDADGVIVNKCVITDEIMEACPSLKYIGTFATGYNNIDIEAASRRGITVCNVPGYSTDAVAQQTLAFILNAASSVSDYIASVARGDWKNSYNFCYYPYFISELKGKTVGVFGYGAIGKAVARLCEAFGMRVLVHARTKKQDCAYPQVSATELFKESDYLTFHCPLTTQTKGIINEETLALMKEEAVIINTARGGLVNEEALVKALNNGKIRAYYADVLTSEPMKRDCLLFGVKNCYLTPHVAWAGRETRKRLVEIVVENLRAYKKGKPQNKVND